MVFVLSFNWYMYLNIILYVWHKNLPAFYIILKVVWADRFSSYVTQFFDIRGFHLVEDSQVTFSEIKDSIFAFVSIITCIHVYISVVTNHAPIE